MCIFSGSVQQVSRTRIFAKIGGAHQVLAYEMRLAAATDLAMILPLPTKEQAEGQVTFISLSDYDRFFDDLERCFPAFVSRSMGAVAAAGGGTLDVHRIGAFDASFVPGRDDFSRLDPRFRLAEHVWRELPAYDDYGFAVFQLRAGGGRVHPMALSFATRDTTRLFFPTAHVHDGLVHSTAPFDHLLYAQGAVGSSPWAQGSRLPRDVMDFGNFLIADRTRGLVDRDLPVLRCKLSGDLLNQDQWLPLGAGAG